MFFSEIIMRYVTDMKEIKEIEYYMKLAAQEAVKSTCIKSKRGAIIVKDDKIVGKGYNKVTEGHDNVTLEGLCNPCIREDIHDKSRVELCYAVHAEQMAIIDAGNNKNPLFGARMYHIKVKNGEMQPSGKPSCTTCSKMVDESGIIEFVLWHEEGYAVYDSKEFNKLSFEFILKKGVSNHNN